MLVTLPGIVMHARLAQFSKADRPIPVTGLPSMVAGMTSAPEAEVSQLVMVTSPPVVVKVRSLRSAAKRGKAAESKRARNPERNFIAFWSYHTESGR